ncbi:MAG: hypothetical protein U5R31_12310 [Acidimicrobiia bacterium]|nr:hypothetical protein [Acidimicrobiia bacterium]
MVEAFFKGDVETARRINARLLASYDLRVLATTPRQPHPHQARSCGRSGSPVGHCRPPMGPGPRGARRPRPAEVLEDLG